MTASEIRNITFNENLADSPDWIDEDQHLNDYEHEWVVYYAEEHDADEYETLRAIGLTSTEAEGVIRHV